MGAVSLSGKLPMTLPRIENEMRFSEEQYPGVNDEVLVAWSFLGSLEYVGLNDEVLCALPVLEAAGSRRCA